MKIVTIDTYIEILEYTIKKLEPLKKDLYVLLKNDETVLEDYIMVDKFIKDTKKGIEKYEEQKTIEETENEIQK